MFLKLLSFILLLCAYWNVPSPARAQGYCPPGSTQIPNPNSPGPDNYMCQCPDGSYASIYGCQGSSPSPTPNPQVRYCQDGGACRSDQTCCAGGCCNQGSYCTRFGCTPIGAVDCGSHYCNPGQKCARNRNGCLPLDVVDCVEYTCQSGLRCAANSRACLSAADTECGTQICRAGYYCGSRDTCIKVGNVDCGNGSYCAEGYKCGSGKRCFAADDVDCGNGSSCVAGYACRKEGGCATPEQLAAEVEAKKKAEQEEAIEQKRIADQNAIFVKIMNDPKQPMLSRKLAAAILGKEVPAMELSQTEREAIAPTLKKNISTPTTSSSSSYLDRVVAAALSNEYLSNVMNDQRQYVSTRRIAALALAKDPYSIVSPPRSGRSATPQLEPNGGAKSQGVILNPNVITDIAKLTPPPSPKTESKQPSSEQPPRRPCSTFQSNDPTLDEYGCPKTPATKPARTSTKPKDEKKKEDSNPFSRQPTPEELAAQRAAEIKADPMRLERVPKKIEEVTKCPAWNEPQKYQLVCKREDGTIGPGWPCKVCKVVTSCSVKKSRDCIEEESSCKPVCKAERKDQRIEIKGL